MRDYCYKGTFIISNAEYPNSGMIIGLSGNARQRRLIVRRWKQRGYIVKTYNTREIK